MNNPLGKERGFDAFVIVALLAITLLIRLPYFFPAVINWDESSSILIGQAILDGQLPYVELWDVKPPLLYYAFAAIIWLFGATIEGVRAGGALCVALTAIAVYVYTRTVWRRSIGVVAAVLTVILICGQRGSGATMSEHLALVPFMVSLVLMRHGTLGYGRAIAMGLLLCAAGLVRLNLALVAVSFMLLVFFHAPLRGGRSRFALVAVIGLAGLAGVAASGLPNLLGGSMDRWWSAVFAAPMSYASSQHSVASAALLQVFYFVRTGYLLGWAVLACALVFLVRCARARSTTASTDDLPDRTQRLILLTYFGATLVSVLLSGGAFAHYLIQISPFMAIFAAAVLVPALGARHTPARRRGMATAAVVVMLIAMLPTLGAYRALSVRSEQRGTLRFSPEYAIAGYLRTHSTPQDGVYMMTDHIVYWFLGKAPIDQAVTHPSNIAKSYLLKHMRGEATTPDAALNDLFTHKRPRFVVRTQELAYLKTDLDALAVIDHELATSYVLETNIEGRQIYRRKN
ncbi:MAG: glycosyltransferase family 39 protein [Rhodocyclaceae bacterium]